MDPTLKLFLVRHGETAWSLTGQHTGVTDLPLTSLGEQMARALAPMLGKLPFSHVQTSPRLRARVTCALVGLTTAVEIVPDLAEWDYGDYESLRTCEIRKHCSDWDIWRDGCPNGESPAEVSARADRLIERLRTLGGNVALFSHGQLGRALAARWIGLKVEEGRHFALNPASISILGVDPDHALRPVITLWNGGPISAEAASCRSV
ncbi:histidine phosphatase family protein [Acidovorax sp. A1169]|uniref:histidine phosphatase family protein n=1 Tax=Acidovorax sp. A1169 TaxID=3059524 RepID=UPI002737A935|nr:histidine phosphatase family protein [Acidovorax sp. A1169]MDP4078956.1 histidine phosphatase family protein [Acidovorax sp. A1169]